MSIDRLGPIDPIQNYGKTGQVGPNQRQSHNDSISVSEEARLKSELYNAAETVRSTSDVRADRVAEVKSKLENPNYIDNVVLNAVAERIIDLFDTE